MLMAEADFDRAAAAYAEHGGRAARDALVLGALVRFRPIIETVARRHFRGRSGAIDDLRQEAAVLVLEAIDSFDPSRGMALRSWLYTALVRKLRRAGLMTLGAANLRENDVQKADDFARERRRLVASRRPAGDDDVICAIGWGPQAAATFAVARAMSSPVRLHDGGRSIEDASPEVVPAEAAEEAAIVRGWLDAIGEPDASVALDHFGRGMAFRELARRRGRSKGWAHRHAMAALARLRVRAAGVAA